MQMHPRMQVSLVVALLQQACVRAMLRRYAEGLIFKPNGLLRMYGDMYALGVAYVERVLSAGLEAASSMYPKELACALLLPDVQLEVG
jgi:hypothetical protein